jgi:hypothetical protein
MSDPTLSNRPSLFDLAGELRNEIYDYIIFDKNDGPGCHRSTTIEALRLTSRRVKGEIEDRIFIATNKLAKTLTECRVTLPDKSSWAIPLRVSGAKTYADTCPLTIALALPALEHLCRSSDYTDDKCGNELMRRMLKSLPPFIHKVVITFDHPVVQGHEQLHIWQYYIGIVDSSVFRYIEQSSHFRSDYNGNYTIHSVEVQLEDEFVPTGHSMDRWMFTLVGYNKFYRSQLRIGVRESGGGHPFGVVFLRIL